MNNTASSLFAAAVLFFSAVLMVMPAALPLIAAELQPDTPVPAFSGSARVYATTAQGGMAKESFQAEITVTVKSGHGGNGCAFMGLGNGKPDPKAYGEPTLAPSLVFRLAPNDFGGGRVLATVDGQPAEEAQLGDGTHRLRLSWDAVKKCAWLEIHRNWKPGARFASTGLLQVPGGAAVFNNDTRLFVGGAEDVLFAVFAEPAKQAKKPQGTTAFLAWTKVEVKAGGTVTVSISSDGKIIAPQSAGEKS